MTAKSSSQSSSLREKAEARIKKMPHSPLDLTMDKARILLHELEVHQIELEMQNQELRESQHRLEEARDQYTDLFDFAPVGYLLLNQKGIITNINLTACQMIGVERLHLKGKPLSAYMTSLESGKLFLKLREGFEQGELGPFEIEMKRHGKENFIALLQGTVDKKDDAKELITRISMQDVTELRKTEELQERHNDLKREKISIEKSNLALEKIVEERTQELSDALENEKQINEMKSSFITIASHELRTPITIIMSSIILIEKLKDLGQNEKIDKHIQRIKSSVQHFTTILEDFLSLEKLERGVIRVQKDNFEIPEFCYNIIEEISSILKAGQKINYVHTGDSKFNVDKKILRNIILNLLSNAIKYSENDVDLKSKIEANQLQLNISDKGIGIPQEEQQYLFKRFFRATNAKNFQGTGLGLSIVQRYLELLGGTIQFTSSPDKGSTFTITLRIE